MTSRLLSGMALVVLGAALSCSEGQTSSSTHWILCETDADCADVVGATACVQGYCVDADGQRLPASSAASPGNGGAAGEGGGTAGEGAGGTAGASDGCPENEPVEGADCSEPDLLCSYVICSPGTGSCSVQAWCGDGVWQLTYTDCACDTRPCSERQCPEGLLCVDFETVLGPTQTLEGACLPDPCAPDPLDCSCAQTLCETRPDVVRMCLVDLTGSQLGPAIRCQDPRQ